MLRSELLRFELHCHSTCSDGREPPARVAARAAERAIDVFALTDHDTCAGSAEIAGAAPRALRAVEITCDDPASRRTIHVLAYDRGGDWGVLEARLAEVREGRRNRMRVMAARLAQRGIHIDVEPMIAAAASSGRSIGRPDLAQAMVDAGAATSRQDAFARHLFDGGPVDVARSGLSIADALALGRAAGAAMALAHPHVYDHIAVALLRRHRGDGLTGIEALYAAYEPTERARWTDLANELDLTCTAGTDCHGPDDGALGVDVPDDRAARLCAWLSP